MSPGATTDVTLDDFVRLQTPEGEALLAQLRGEALEEAQLLEVLARYRKSYPPALVAAAVELTRVRRRAAEKFADADALWFTRTALEMASAEAVARHTAARFAGRRRVLDLCCGAGGDALALADCAGQVTAVERDPLVLAMARANARARHRHDRIDFVRADVIDFMPTAPLLLGRPDAIFIDPSRRHGDRRVSRRDDAYSPPLAWCLELVRHAPAVGIKAAPALDYAALPVEAEVEIISLHGECKAAMLWLGDVRTGARRATVLPAGATLTDAGATSDAVGDIGAWLYEPDGAVIRAHLVQRLAGAYGLRRLDPEIAYLTGEAEIDSPLLTGYRVQAVLPWSLKRLQAELTARDIGRATIKKRGFPLTPEALRAKLTLRGPARATLICTRAQGAPVVVIAE